MAVVDTMLWCVNITGPDDVLAVSSRAEAVELAAKFNDLAVSKFEVDPHEDAPLMWAVPRQWPHSPASHAENLGDLGEYGWLRTAPAPAAKSAPELLEALREARAAVAYEERGTEAGSEDEAQLRITLSKIDAAIAKAGA